jgi:hypothetical protein
LSGWPQVPGTCGHFICRTTTFDAAVGRMLEFFCREEQLFQ